jgi:hypothetical protein
VGCFIPVTVVRGIDVNQIPAALLGSFQRAPWGWALLVTALLGLIKIWPVLTKLSIEARAQIRKERRDDLSDCQRQLAEVRVEIRNLATDFNNLKIELAATLSAYRILEIEVEAVNPTSIGLAEARAILSTAFTVAPAPVSMRPPT